jgi:uncharacterized protein (TIGR03083 family)
MTSIPATTAGPAMRHRDWMAAAEEEYRRLDEVLAALSADDWQRPTECTGWSVRDMVAHLAGAAESTASVAEVLRQAWGGRTLRQGGPLVDGINAVQVGKRRNSPPERLRPELAAAGARGVRRRSRMPAALRAVVLPLGPPVGTKPLGYLLDRIYTRDAWMHRIDLARATGRPLRLTADHDGRIVADIVAEWAAAHGRPYRLTLTGQAGGSWSHGTGGEEIVLDAVEFCRIMADRADGTGLLAQHVPF